MERKGQRVERVVIPLRKSEPRDINESQRRRKLAPSCISLMKIGWIAFTTDVSDGDTAILDPFTDGVLAMSDVTVPLCGQIMAPLHTCIIVVVEWCSYEGVVGRVPKQGKMKNHIANVDCKTGSHVSGMDLDITRAEGGTIFMLSFPSDRTARSEDDGTTYTAKFEER